MSWQAATASPRLRRLPEGTGSPLTGLLCGSASSGSLGSPRGPSSPLAGSSLPTPQCWATPLDAMAANQERASLPGSPLLPNAQGGTGHRCLGSVIGKNSSQDLHTVRETQQFQGIDPKRPATESFDAAIRLIVHAVNSTTVSFVHRPPSTTHRFVPETHPGTHSRVSYRGNSTQIARQTGEILSALMAAVDIVPLDHCTPTSAHQHTVPELFHTRLLTMKTTLCEFDIKGLHCGCKACREDKGLSAPERALADQIAGYVESHQLNLNNCIIGSEMSELAQKMVTESKSHFLTESAITTVKLLECIGAWQHSQHSDSDSAARNLQQFYSTLPTHMRCFDQGDIVATTNPANPARTALVYGRVIEPYRPQLNTTTESPPEIVVALDPLETDLHKVPLSSVHPLSEDLVTMIKKDVLNSVHNPFLETYNKMTEAAQAALACYLHRENLDEFPSLDDTFAAIQGAKPVISMVPLLTALSGQLSHLLSGSVASESAIEQLRQPVEKVLERLRNDIQEKRLRPCAHPDMPMRSLAESADARRFVERFLRTTDQRCRETNEGLSRTIAAIHNGSAKNELTQWYLKEVREAADALMSARGVIADAVPDNYMEEPPPCIDDVRRNSHICSAISSHAQTDSDTRARVQKLCDTVYPRIDNYARQVREVLALELGISQQGNAAFMEEVRTRVSAAVAAGERPAAHWKQMVADVEYIEQMKALEQSTEPAASKDIVPISGLFFSRISRRENECKTVLQIWGNRH